MCVCVFKHVCSRMHTRYNRALHIKQFLPMRSLSLARDSRYLFFFLFYLRINRKCVSWVQFIALLWSELHRTQRDISRKKCV
jgi:hypothetical protein